MSYSTCIVLRTFLLALAKAPPYTKLLDRTLCMFPPYTKILDRTLCLFLLSTLNGSSPSPFHPLGEGLGMASLPVQQQPEWYPR